VAFAIIITVIFLISVVAIGASSINLNLGPLIDQLKPLQSSMPTAGELAQRTMPTKTPSISVEERREFLSFCESFRDLHTDIQNFNDEWNSLMPELEDTDDVNKMYSTTMFFLNWWTEIIKSASELPETKTAIGVNDHLAQFLDCRYKSISALADHFYSGEMKFHEQFSSYQEHAYKEYLLTRGIIWNLAVKYGYNPNDCLE
jgi:hypothetical protein